MKRTKPRIGRKPLSDKDRRTVRFPVNLNVEEEKLILSAATLCDDAPLVWGRKILLAAARERLKP